MGGHITARSLSIKLKFDFFAAFSRISFFRRQVRRKNSFKGKTPDEGFPQGQSTGLFFHLFLRFMRQKSSAFCGKRQERRPLTPPPFEKGGRKLFMQYFC